MKLYELIKKNRYKVKDVADACGVTSAAVVHWCNGSCMPSIDNLRKLSQFFGVTIDDLIGEDDDEGRAESEA